MNCHTEKEETFSVSLNISFLSQGQTLGNTGT